MLFQVGTVEIDGGAGRGDMYEEAFTDFAITALSNNNKEEILLGDLFLFACCSNS